MAAVALLKNWVFLLSQRNSALIVAGLPGIVIMGVDETQKDR